MANKITLAMPFRPALARLRRSTRYAVLGLAAIAIAGCSPVNECRLRSGETVMVQRKGVVWKDAEGWTYPRSEFLRCRVVKGE